MTDDMKIYPQRPESHVIGEEAVSIFLSACPSEWITMPIQPDYGLDLRIEMSKGNNVTGEEFFVQVKGRKNVKINHDGFVLLEISQATINYWLGKLHPVLIVLVDVTKGDFWYGWLEFSYPKYPQTKNKKEKVKLCLRNNSTKDNFAENVPKYLNDYFDSLRKDLSKTFETTQVTRMLFHVTQLWQHSAQMVIFLQSDTKGMTDEEIISKWQLFYQEFALNDLFLRIPWHIYANQNYEKSKRIIESLESRFKAYEKFRSTFFHLEDSDKIEPNVPIISVIPKSKDVEMKLQYVKPRYKELLENIFPTMNVLKEIDEMLFQILLIGRVKFELKIV
jgi:uncharacterized protein DUF4365